MNIWENRIQEKKRWKERRKEEKKKELIHTGKFYNEELKFL
jgi:hypothetical protein